MINNIRVKNFICIKNIGLENLTNKKEIYFLGENGVGKTVLLQGILMNIHNIDFKLYQYLPKINGKISAKTTESDKFQTNVFAYGTGRFRDSESNTNVDKSGYATLFDRNTLLINPIQWFKDVLLRETQNESQLKIETVLHFFTEIINFEDDNTFRIEREGSKFTFFEKETKTEFEHLAEGYRSVLIWLSDLLSRLTENQPHITDLKDFSGVVLVDEIDMFLHPKWEYSIVKKLRAKLPNIQWFFTTHSPMLILGASEDAVFYKLYKEDGKTKISEQWQCQDIDNLLANAILTSPLFDLETARMRSFAKSDKKLNTSEDFEKSILSTKVTERILKLKEAKKYISKKEIEEITENTIVELSGTNSL